MRTTFLLAIALFAAVNANATIRTLSNNTNSPGQFTNFAAAQTASTAGDTIYIHGSPYNYGSFTLTKQLTVIGIGHNPQKQAPLKSFVDYIYFATGSNGSKVIGMEIYEVHTNAANINNIEFRSCKITYRMLLDDAGSSNWIVDGCVFTNTGDNFYGASSQSGHRLRNNVFNGQLTGMYSGNGYHYIENNIFLRNGDAFYYVNPAYVNNNIFYRANPSGTGNGITYSNNISYQCSNNNFPNGTNLTNQDPQFVSFTGGGAGTNFSYSHNYNLQATSPAKNYGTDSKDLGVYGGVGDYNQNGIPRIPYISEFNISNPTVSPGGTLNIDFKSKVR
ncbi:MAG: hypothetical protein IPN22_15060 [Bacteroidetes bacterium]|nr:hypothetical protein [Bacteroidota bacterium]